MLADGAAWEAAFADGGTALILFRNLPDADRCGLLATPLYADETGAATASLASATQRGGSLPGPRTPAPLRIAAPNVPESKSLR